jgi:predicted hydrocarbon binding protein
MVCDHPPGSLAGAFQVILDHERRGIRVVGRETKCVSNGDPWCEFVVEPEGKAISV